MGFFHENSLIMTCSTLGNIGNIILKSNGFKNQSNDILKLLRQNYVAINNGLLNKLTTVALHDHGLS